MSAPGDLHPDEMISAYLDSEASPEETERVEEHLRTCARCRGLVEDFRSLSAAGAQEEPPPVPLDLAARIRRRAEGIERQGRTSGGREWWRPLSLVAAGFAVATLVYLAMPLKAPVSPSPTAGNVSAPAPRQEAPAASPAPLEKKQKAAGQAGTRAGGKSPEGAAGTWPEGYGESAPGAVKMAAGEASPAIPVTGDRVDQGPQGNAAEGEERRGIGGGASAPADLPGTPGEAAEKDKAEGAALAARSDLAAVPRPAGKSAPGRVAESRTASALVRDKGLSGETAGPRSLSYETPEITVTLSEDGMVTLVLRGYACSVSVSPPGAQGSSSVPELESIFRKATGKEILSAAAASGRAEAGASEESSQRFDTLTLSDSEGGALYSLSFGDAAGTEPPRQVLELAEEIRRAVGQSFRSALQERCGPLPGDAPFPSP